MTDDNEDTSEEAAANREEPLGGLADEVAADESSPDTGEQPPRETGTHPEAGPARDAGDPTDGPRPDEPVPGSGVDEDRKGPLSDLASQVDRRRERGRTESDDLFEEAFDDVGVEETDTEALWEDLESGSLDTGVEQPEVAVEEETYLVDKSEYCQRCQFFSDPPDVRCTYEDSEIVEVEDTQQFRVRGCPIVEGNEDLQNLEK